MQARKFVYLPLAHKIVGRLCNSVINSFLTCVVATVATTDIISQPFSMDFTEFDIFFALVISIFHFYLNIQNFTLTQK